jgi:hypothetical protein
MIWSWVLLALSLVTFVGQVWFQVIESSNVTSLLLQLYTRVYSLGNQGVNVTGDVVLLNQAIHELSRGNYTGAIAIANEVNDQLSAGEAYVEFTRIVYVLVLVLLFVSLFLLIRYRERIVGGLWLWVRGSHRVRIGDGRSRALFLSEEVMAIIVAVVIVSLVFSLIYPFSRGISAPYESLGILGPCGGLGCYPIVHVGDEVEYYGYVYSFARGPTWYVVYVGVIENSTARIIDVKERILLVNETWVFPIQLTINNTNTVLTMELWMYDPVNGTLVFTGAATRLKLPIAP